MIDRPDTDADTDGIELDDEPTFRPIIPHETLAASDPLDDDEDPADEPIGDLVAAVSERIADLVDLRIAAEAGGLAEGDPFGFSMIAAIPISPNDPRQIGPVPAVRIVLSPESPEIVLVRIAGLPWILSARWGSDTIVRHLTPKIVAALDSLRWTLLADELLDQIGGLDDLSELSALGGFDPPPDL